MFEVTARDEAIQIILSNNIMAGVVKPDMTACVIGKLNSYSDKLLGVCLVQSRRVLDLRLAKTAQAWRN